MNAVNRVVREWAAGFWLGILFWLTRHAPWAPRLLKPAALWFAWWAPGVRDATLANARWLLGPASTGAQRRAQGRGVLSSFYEAVVELGVNRRLDKAAILRRLESVVGEERYDAARAVGKGAVLVTAHLGSFETAIAMLTEKERRVHVVFRRDRNRAFERTRAEQHAKLGVLEAPTDDGLGMWMRMRDALRADEVVLVQGDRVLPGEKGECVPFMGGHMRLPAGPVKLARAAGAPLIPGFAVQVEGGRVRILLGEPIWPAVAACTDGVDPVLLKVAEAIEGCIRRYPSQWLVLHRAWSEDDRGQDLRKGRRHRWISSNASS